MNKTIIITVVISALLILGGVLLFSGNSHSSSSALDDKNDTKSNRDVALSCTLDMYTQFHIHPHLQIIINGQNQVIPADVGIVNNCMHPLHTHDDTGKLHVESPVKRDFTLADFFAVWGKTFTKDQILDSKVDDQHIIKETINGQEVKDFENTILHDGDQIVISYESKG